MQLGPCTLAHLAAVRGVRLEPRGVAAGPPAMRLACDPSLVLSRCHGQPAEGSMEVVCPLTLLLYPI